MAGRVCAGCLIAVNVLTVGHFYTYMQNERNMRTDLSIPTEKLVFDDLYLPRGMENNAFDDDNLLYDGGITIKRFEKQKGVITIECMSGVDTEQAITLPLVYYPYYKAAGDAGALTVSEDAGGNHRVAVAVPAGYEGTIRVKFAVPLLWRICEAVSGISILAAPAYAVMRKKKKDRKKIV